MRPAVRRKRAEKGTSLVEVVIALGILLILMIGILQMFSLAYLTNMNAAADTELASKAQQTAEVLRWALFQQANGGAIGISPNNLDPALYLAVGTYTIPETNTGAWNFWGPSGVGVQTGQNPPYTITYTIANSADGNSRTVTVQVQAKITGNYTYVGAARRGKVVDYVLQAPNAAP